MADLVDLQNSGSTGAESGPPRPVFISYPSPDATVAQKVCSALEGAGFPCWMAPRDVVPGMLYADGIIRAINETTVLVLILSKSAIDSAHVGKEIERAASKRHPIIAFRTDTAPLTPAFEYFLSESQWIESRAAESEAAMASLIGAVKQHLLPGAAAARAQSLTASAVVRPFVTRRGSALIGGAVAVLGLTAALIFVRPGWRHGWSASTVRVAAGPSETMEEKSIAVLPFTDMSESHNQEYFGDGMAEEILDLLAKIPGLTVIGRTSSFQFKGKGVDLRAIGAKLNAAHILEGSVRKSSDEVRITAQLINAQTGSHEWSQTYDRRVGDVLILQDAIAAAVVRELQLTVAPGDLNARSALKNVDAYNLLLRARHAADRVDRDGLDEAVALLTQALNHDPTSGDAEAELANIYLIQVLTGSLTATVGVEQARDAAASALKLDPRKVRARLAMAWIHTIYDWDWAGAQRELQQAALVAPGNSEVQSGESSLFYALGRWDDALRRIKLALIQDPLNIQYLHALGAVQASRGHWSEAVAASRRMLDIHPTTSYGHFDLGCLLLASGDRDGALHEIQQETSDDGKLQGLALVYFAIGNHAAADAALASMLKDQAKGSPFAIAEVYAFRNQADEAVHWLERAYAQKDIYLYSIKGDFLVKNLEDDPRYHAFLRKMNLPE